MTEFREFQDGEVIEGTRYRVLRLIGVGGMGSVYEVEHIELGKRFVLKALLRELSRRDDLVQRLRNEWRALARLQHDNIVNVTDAGTSGGGVPFYVMERLDGDTLAALLRQKRRLHVVDAANIASSVLEALSAAHEIGVIHRDVKPANVFIVNGGGVKLLDFGIAKIADATGVVTARGLAVGTPRYMSPEQARGERVDGRSDIYASALLLFEMIAGVGPFDDALDSNELLLAHLAREAPPLSSLVRGVSPELEQILASMLAKDCRQRPPNARHAAEQLRSFALRQRSAPATDAPTAQAGYGAQTVDLVREGVAKPIHESITRAEGAARKQLARDANLSDDALTQRISRLHETTQVTLSISTGESLSVSSVPNTTFVSPPPFDGTTTLQMSSVPSRTQSPVPLPPDQPFAERPEPTEMLGELPPLVEPPVTRTQVPLSERARPVSLTPPPVVDTGRSESSGSLRVQRVGRWAGRAAAGVALLIATGLVWRWAATRGGSPASVAAARPVALKTPIQAGLPPEPVAESGPLPAAAPKAALTASVSPTPALTASVSPTPASSARLVGSPAASGSGRNLRMILGTKHYGTVSVRNLQPRTRGPGPGLPGSGL